MTWPGDQAEASSGMRRMLLAWSVSCFQVENLEHLKSNKPVCKFDFGATVNVTPRRTYQPVPEIMFKDLLWRCPDVSICRKIGSQTL